MLLADELFSVFLTSFLDLPLDEGVLLKPDLENEEAEEHMDACVNFVCLSKCSASESFVGDDDIFAFFAFPAVLES